MIPIPLGATLICVILFSCPVRLPVWVRPTKSQVWMEASSLEQYNTRPDTLRPQEVKLELGVGGLY